MKNPHIEEFRRQEGPEITGLKYQYEQARMSAVRARMAELEMELRTGEIIDGALYLLQKPLNVIKAMSDNLKRQSVEKIPMGVALDEALDSGYAAMKSMRLAKASDKLIAKAPVNINKVIRDVLVISADRLSANGIIVDWRPEHDLPLVLGEEIQLCILLRILLDNAILAVEQQGATGREVRIDTSSGNDGLIDIRIQDTGPGIDKDLHSKIFEPFFTGWGGNASGSGMGLAIARQILGELRGEILIETAHRTGCAICISLQVCRIQKS